MGGACPSTLKPRDGEDESSPPAKVRSVKSLFLRQPSLPAHARSHLRRVPNAEEEEEEEGRVRLGPRHSVAGDGKLDVWSAGYGSVPKTVEMNVSRQSFRPTLSNPTSREPPSRGTPPDFDELKCLRTLGVGSFGRVVLMEHVPTQTAFAMKRMSRAFIKKYRHEETARREREILGAVDSPFLSNLVASYSGAKCLYVLLDWCEGGELLLQLERRKNGRFNPETAAFYVAGVSVGLMYLHARGIVFRGVKPENVMLAKNGYPVLIDFGFAKNIGIGGRTHTLVGAPDYIAPEILMRKRRNEGYDYIVDYWSLGCLAYELLTGLPPFSPVCKQRIYGAESEERMFRFLSQGVIEKHVSSNAPLRWVGTRHHPIPAVARNFVEQLLVGDPAVRLGGTETGGKDRFIHHAFMYIVETTCALLWGHCVAAAHGDWADIETQSIPAPTLVRGEIAYVPPPQHIDASFFEPQMEPTEVMTLGTMGWLAMKDFERKPGSEGQRTEVAAETSIAATNNAGNEGAAEGKAPVDAEREDAAAAAELAALEEDWDALYGVPATEDELVDHHQEHEYAPSDSMFSARTDPINEDDEDASNAIGAQLVVRMPSLSDSIDTTPKETNEKLRRSSDGDVQRPLDGNARWRKSLDGVGSGGFTYMPHSFAFGAAWVEGPRGNAVESEVKSGVDASALKSEANGIASALEADVPAAEEN